MKFLLFMAWLAAFATTSCSHSSHAITAKPRMTESEVLAVAETAMTERYPELVAAHRLYQATFWRGVWDVFATVPDGIRGGGAPETSVRDSDGRVLGVFLSR